MLKKIRIGMLLNGTLCAVLANSMLNSMLMAQAQPLSTPQPDIVVMVDNLPTGNQQPENTKFVVFAPGKTQPKPLFEATPDSLIQISPDGTQELVTIESQAVLPLPGFATQPAASNTNPAIQGAGPLAYGPIGQNLKPIPVDTGHQILSSTFSANGRYLSYTTAALDGSDWVLGIVEVATGKRIEFGGDYEKPAAGVFAGVANTIGWSADGKRIFVQNYEPFSANGGFDSVYSLDISGASFDQGARLPIPPGVRLIKDGLEIGNVAVSSDGTKLAYSYSVNANATPDAFPNETPPDTIAILDVTSISSSAGSPIASFKVDPGQAFAFPLSWSPDGKKLVFAGGSSKNSAAVSSSKLYILDMDTKQTTTTPIVSSDPASSVEYVTACSDSVFYVVTQPDASGQAITATLFSAPLSDLKTATTLQSASFISLLNCVPAS